MKAKLSAPCHIALGVIPRSGVSQLEHFLVICPSTFQQIRWDTCEFDEWIVLCYSVWRSLVIRTFLAETHDLVGESNPCLDQEFM